MIKRHKILIASAFILALASVIFLYLPHFLIYSTDYKKADAIILLLGPDFKARQKEANDLIKIGMADYLIIPAYSKTYGIYDKGRGRYLLSDYRIPQREKDRSPYPDFYEDTHIEVIKAQKIMSGYGLESAIFVSSPYHMRRIKLIAGKVFDADGRNFYFVPTRYEKAPVNGWELSSSDWKKVRRECGKILWFFIYYPWS